MKFSELLEVVNLRIESSDKPETNISELCMLELTWIDIYTCSSRVESQSSKSQLPCLVPGGPLGLAETVAMDALAVGGRPPAPDWRSLRSIRTQSRKHGGMSSQNQQKQIVPYVYP